MKVVHLTTSISGGAGIACLRLHKALLKSGVDSTVLCLKCEYPLPEGIERYFESSTLLQRTYRYFKRLISEKVGFKPKPQNSLLENVEIFSTPFSDFQPENHDLIKSANIIHLHWVSGFVNVESFFSKIKVPIFWTFHDMNPFLGGFHYEGDLRRSISQLVDLEEKFRDIKRRAIIKTNLFPVYLSRWMKNKASQFDFQIEGKVVSNCIDFNLFRLYQGDFREVFSLPKDKIIFLFVAERIDNKRKGLAELIKVIKNFDDPMAHFVALGGFNRTAGQNRIQFISTIKEERYLNLLYNSVDYLILPSLEDNLPNTMLEALASGCPVISSQNGGMAEHIVPDKNGWIFEDFEDLPEVLNRAILKCESISPEFVRKEAKKKFNELTVASRILTLYQAAFT